MSDRAQYFIHLACILGTGLIAGTFFAFSTFIMAALERLHPGQGISAMQAINITVINPLFMGVLFGTAALSAYLGYQAYGAGLGGQNTLILIAALFYFVGAIGTTMVFNVPLNEGLAILTSSGAGNDAFWHGYVRDWTWWNSVRGFSAAVSTVMFVLALH